MPVPASAISYAPYGDSVFVVAELEGPNGQTYRGVRQQFVKLGPSRGDQIVDRLGSQAGRRDRHVRCFQAANGAAVLVNNKVQPGNNPAPKPEDN